MNTDILYSASTTANITCEVGGGLPRGTEKCDGHVPYLDCGDG